MCEEKGNSLWELSFPENDARIDTRRAHPAVAADLASNALRYTDAGSGSRWVATEFPPEPGRFWVEEHRAGQSTDEVLERTLLWFFRPIGVEASPSRAAGLGAR